MRSIRRCGLFLAASLLCVSCDRSAIDPSQSLVGAKELPPAKVLSREIIEINRSFGAYLPPRSLFLSYQLRPDDSLVVSLTERKYPEDAVLGKEAFHLAREVATETRQMLWRLRPEELKDLEEGLERETLPLGCGPLGLHESGELGVVFIAEADEAGVEDDRVAIFVLPRTNSCSTRQAREARQLVQRVMRLFPPSKVAAEYQRRAERLREQLES